MADLMKKVSADFVSPKKGQILEATITKLTSSEILVDIGAKTEAVVLEKDRRLLKNLLNSLKVGDKVKVSVLNPESDFGNPVVSLRRFMDEKLWVNIEDLKNKKVNMDGEITQVSRGGFMVTTENGIQGFLPNSQTTLSESHALGAKIKVSILEIDKLDKKIILSQKEAASEDFEKAIGVLRVDQKIDSIVSNVAPFGVFVSIPVDGRNVEGFIKKDKIPVGANYEVGSKIQTVVSEFDKKNKRVILSPFLTKKTIGYR
jgi:small subunit ribosomal protein S1